LALRSRAFCVIAMVADGLTRERTSARKAIGGLAPFSCGEIVERRTYSEASAARQPRCASGLAGGRSAPRAKLRTPMIARAWVRFCATFFAATSSSDARRRTRMGGRPDRFASCLGDAGKLPKRTAHSPGETKRFASHGVSRWNPYERRISHFAGLFVFSDLTPFSFRRFHGLFVSNDLAPFSFRRLRGACVPGLADAEFVLSDFNQLRRHLRAVRRLTPKAWSRLAHERCKPGSSNFLKNNTRPRPAWQEIVA
jgi:hypothetical protein